MIIESIGKYVGGKVVTAICVVASGAALIWFWRHPEAVQAAWTVVKYGLAWLGFALVLPWLLFPVLPKILRYESNAASAAVLFGLWLADALCALWLCGWHVGDALGATVILFGTLAAAAYNFVICESLARQIEGA